jgi:hypothetical protein
VELAVQALHWNDGGDTCSVSFFARRINQHDFEMTIVAPSVSVVGYLGDSGGSR